MRATSIRRAVGVAAVLAGALLFAYTPIQAHKAVTSKYTFTEDVFPILRDRCGRCHADGGPAPMSLLAYKDSTGGAYAWAGSIRDMLISRAMPPWYADPAGPAVTNTHVMTPRELDILVTWASGGTPLGDPNKVLPSAVPAKTHWTLGKPDLDIPIADHTLPAGMLEDELEVVVPTSLPADAWLKAADLLTGPGSMVRRAEISVENGPVLAVWEPGDDAATAPDGAAFRLPSGANLRVRLVYRKRWQDEQQARTDRSRIGLFFATAATSVKAIDSLAIEGSPPNDPNAGRLVAGTVTHAARLVAIRPSVDRPCRTVEITAVLPSGRRTPVLTLRGARPEWPRRYWLVTPIDLPANTILEMHTEPGDPEMGPPGPARLAPLRVAIDVIDDGRALTMR